ncbi:hypothetical protein CKAH01_06494 [Colletotrichum kahawae]|uniref:Fungal calcium binding protein domain-containing protein n=1 Tax=Colletotrichum kahawae TaxID=34407 RepID=A0AAE0D2X0_COLKA|nr:hypothetical protein CKAH01_06494 [Colletotrichum kahawae]
MKYFALVIGFLALLTPALSLATNYVPRSPVPAPGILDNIKDLFGDLVDDLSDAGKKVLCCGVELGVTSATCLVAVLRRKGAGKTADNLGCLASVVETEQDLKKKEVCDHCWSAITKFKGEDGKV